MFCFITFSKLCKGYLLPLYIHVKMKVKLLSHVRLFATPWTVAYRGIFQAIVLEWIAISFSRGSFQPRDWTQVSLIVDRRFTVWATREVHQHESATGIHVFPIPTPSSLLPPRTIPLGRPSAPALSNEYRASNLNKLLFQLESREIPCPKIPLPHNFSQDFSTLPSTGTAKSLFLDFGFLRTLFSFRDFHHVFVICSSFFVKL